MEVYSRIRRLIKGILDADTYAEAKEALSYLRKAALELPPHKRLIFYITVYPACLLYTEYLKLKERALYGFVRPGREVRAISSSDLRAISDNFSKAILISIVRLRMPISIDTALEEAKLLKVSPLEAENCIKKLMNKGFVMIEKGRIYITLKGLKALEALIDKEIEKARNVIRSLEEIKKTIKEYYRGTLP
ncbi:MAG: hypothetical protein DRN15_04270 [Thermoprotei archaeon]|nr:MAG: hypothetical protein DRM97_06235 [Thermoprotei archaeon]RLF24117.1 MAG: hypothetical protein DRN15_04270 [Thermoprotei archaeon]